MYAKSAAEVWRVVYGQLSAPESHRSPDVGHFCPHGVWWHNVFRPAGCFEGEFVMIYAFFQLFFSYYQCGYWLDCKFFLHIFKKKIICSESALIKLWSSFFLFGQFHPSTKEEKKKGKKRRTINNYLFIVLSENRSALYKYYQLNFSVTYHTLLKVFFVCKRKCIYTKSGAKIAVDFKCFIEHCFIVEAFILYVYKNVKFMMCILISYTTNTLYK